MRNLLSFDSFIIESAETGSYEPPNSPVKIPAGDTGFNMVQKNYNRFMWTLKDAKRKKKKKLNRASIQKQ
jgi:hypothetical protein